MRFEGHSILVAGGTGALGRAVALAFLAEGAAVMVAGRRPEEAASLLAQAGPTASRLGFVQADAGEADGAARAVAAAAGRGRLDAVVNAVGGWRGGTPLHAEAPDALASQLALNLLPGWHLLRAALPPMLAAGRGAVVEVVSLAALGPQPGQAAYGAAKAAALSLVLSAAEEGRARGVRVNAVLPGTMDTPANRRAMPGADPRGWVTTAAVARAVLFLCAEEGRAITGAAVPVTAA